MGILIIRPHKSVFQLHKSAVVGRLVVVDLECHLLAVAFIVDDRIAALAQGNRFFVTYAGDERAEWEADAWEFALLSVLTSLIPLNIWSSSMVNNPSRLHRFPVRRSGLPENYIHHLSP